MLAATTNRRVDRAALERKQDQQRTRRAGISIATGGTSTALAGSCQLELQLSRTSPFNERAPTIDFQCDMLYTTYLLYFTQLKAGTSLKHAHRKHRTVTIKDIARKCDVHFMTVSRALRRDPRVRDTTAQCIRKAAVEMGYDPAAGQAGRQLVSQAVGSRVINQVVGLFFPPNFVRNTYFADLFEGIVEELTPAGFTLHIIPTYSPEHPERMLDELPPILRRGEIDGVIVTEWPQHFGPVLKQLQEEPTFGGRPIISLMDEHEGCSAVLTDDYQGMYAAAKHLLEWFERLPVRQRRGVCKNSCTRVGAHRRAVEGDPAQSKHQRQNGSDTKNVEF